MCFMGNKRMLRGGGVKKFKTKNQKMGDVPSLKTLFKLAFSYLPSSISASYFGKIVI